MLQQVHEMKEIYEFGTNYLYFALKSANTEFEIANFPQKRFVCHKKIPICDQVGIKSNSDDDNDSRSSVSFCVFVL